LTSAAEYGLKASQTDNWPGKRAGHSFPAGFLIQLSAFFPAERRFLLGRPSGIHLTGT
jgi:hypothetical protein